MIYKVKSNTLLFRLYYLIFYKSILNVLYLFKTNHLIFILRFLFAFFLFAMQLSFSQQEWTLPCSDESFYAGSFCYSSNLPFQNYVYISSDDGSAVNLSIIQGLVS